MRAGATRPSRSPSALAPAGAAWYNGRMAKKSVVRLVLLVTGLVAGTVVARRLGYGVGGNTVVRCREGHLYTTIWIPGASLKALRLGWARLQYCPVGLALERGHPGTGGRPDRGGAAGGRRAPRHQDSLTGGR